MVGSRVCTSAHQVARTLSSRSAANRTFDDPDGEAANRARHGHTADAHALLVRLHAAVRGRRGIGLGSDLRLEGGGVLGAVDRWAAGRLARALPERITASVAFADLPIVTA